MLWYMWWKNLFCYWFFRFDNVIYVYALVHIYRKYFQLEPWHLSCVPATADLIRKYIQLFLVGKRHVACFLVKRFAICLQKNKYLHLECLISHVSEISSTDNKIVSFPEERLWHSCSDKFMFICAFMSEEMR